jgi:murein DD-endopeptidase MepM/ murein hydrolase activator NlpD
MTFAQAGLTATSTVPEDTASALEPEEPPPPPVEVPAPESIASEVAEGPPVDATLLRFAAAARDRRAAQPAGRGFPDEAAKAWRTLAADLDAYLGRALPQTPLLELVRARVTVEAEWDYDLRHYGRAPTDLTALVTARAARFATRISTARALGLGLFARTKPPRLRWPVEQAGISSLYGMRTHPVDGRRRMHFGWISPRTRVASSPPRRTVRRSRRVDGRLRAHGGGPPRGRAHDPLRPPRRAALRAG